MRHLQHVFVSASCPEQDRQKLGITQSGAPFAISLSLGLSSMFSSFSFMVFYVIIILSVNAGFGRASHVDTFRLRLVTGCKIGL